MPNRQPAAHSHAALQGHQVLAGSLLDVLCNSYLYLLALHTVIKPAGIVGRTCWNTMRLLKSSATGSGFELTSFNDDLVPPYAILSHTWTENQEVTYDELLKGTGTDKDGYAKIRFCGERAAADGLEYFWVDTCCINKATSDELSTAINSMFRWYQRAAKCYVLLTDVSIPEEVTSTEISGILWKQAFQRSRWFTRGWTLQELLAPASVEFFSRDGKWLGNKMSLEQEIHRVTSIPVKALRGHSLAEFSIEERMSWSAQRTTTIREDKVYCLLGIFGVFLPLIYGEGEGYAALRLEEEIQKRQQGSKKADLQNSSAVLSIPFPRNERFAGREIQLQSMKQVLLSPGAHQWLTIYGLGGCGKSALALEFAYRAFADQARRLVFWVPAMSQESFELAYRDIGAKLRIPGINDANADVKQLVRDALSSGNLGSWLMIIDNADDSEVLLGVSNKTTKLDRLIDYVPRSTGGSVLFTTRSRKAATDLTPNNVLKLNEVDKSEARQLFVHRINNQASLNDETAADALLETLTGLPLAIVQAAAFINQNEISVSEYASLLQDAGTKAELFSEHFEDLGRYRDMDSTVAKTWYISFEQIQRQDPLAAEYLSFIGCIDRIGIPQSLLPPERFAVQQTKAIGTLTGYAFITERRQAVPGSSTERLFDMHRLVHMALIWWLEGHGKREEWAGIAAARAEKLLPYGDYRSSEIWSVYIPHAMYLAGLVGLVDDLTRASLLTRVGQCQAALGLYELSATTQRIALSLRNKALGPEHLDTLQTMGCLAFALDGWEKYDEVEAIRREELAIREKVQGPEDEDTLTTMGGLSLVLYNQRNFVQAEALGQQTLAQCKKLLGPEHPNTLATMTNLALVLESQGRCEEAEILHKQRLEITEKLFGPEHPVTLQSTLNLAMMLFSKKQYTEAEAMCQKVLDIRKKVSGPTHPSTLNCMNSLALVLTCRGKYTEAEVMCRQTLKHQENLLGPEHPNTLRTIRNLALTLYRQEKHTEAEGMYRQALKGRGKVLGPEHVDTLSTLYDISLCLEEQKRVAEALPMLYRSLTGFTAVLGEAHPFTVSCRMGYNHLLELQEKDD